MADEVRPMQVVSPDCECEVEFSPLPVCENDAVEAILCAVAYEQAEMARMLKVLRCKLCYTVSWLPDAFETPAEAIDAAVRIEADVAGLIRALADKENAIANKLRAALARQEG